MTDGPSKANWIPQVRDWKLTSCVEYGHAAFVTADIKTKALEPVLKAFRYNVSGVRMLMHMPSHIGDLGMSLQKCIDLAEQAVTGKVTLESTSGSMERRVADRFEDFWNNQLERDRKLRATPEWETVHIIEGLKSGLHPVVILGNSTPPAEFRALLGSYITAAWTAFETMAGDLWEVALNTNPQGLAHLKGRPAKSAPEKQPAGTVKKPKEPQESPKVDLDLIQFHQFDLRNKMGTILRGKYELSRLAQIRMAYAAAFDRDSGRIDAALSHKSLDGLSAVRNLLVHKAGFIDAEYLRRSQHLDVPTGDANTLIGLDGEIVVNLIKPALERAADLIGAVDDWLDKHK